MGYDHQVRGGCHCGNIRLTYHSPVPPPEMPVRRCDCSFCQKQGACYTSHPDGRLEVEVLEPLQVRQYRFGTLTAAAWICTKCGGFPFFSSEIDGRVYAVLNVNTLEDFDYNRMTVPTLSLSEEPVEKRLDRRRRAWIGQVVLPERG